MRLTMNADDKRRSSAPRHEIRMTRRQFAAAAAAMAFTPSSAPAATPFPVRYARTNPYELLSRFIPPGSDSFAGEKEASEIEARLYRIFSGVEPAPTALREWAARRAEIRWARFHVLPGGR